MRLVLTLLALSGTAGYISSSEPPAQKERTKQDILKQLEGDWVLKSVIAATPQGVSMVVVDAPNLPKQGLTFKDGYQIITKDGKPISSKHPRLEPGPEPECLLLCGPPDKKPFKVRFKIEGVTLTLVQDMRFKEECPESFDPEKGRYRDRRVLTFTWHPRMP